MATVMKYSIDRYLLICVIALLALGILMVTSASMAVSQKHYGQPFHFLYHHLCYVGLGIILAIIITKVPILFWENVSRLSLLISLLLLVIIFIPGMGHRVNGSLRWIGLGPFRVQLSEFVKFSMVIYLSSYLVRHQKQVCTSLIGFIKPLLVLGIIALLLLMEPDFGAVVVMTLTSFGMMFLGGVRVWQFIVLMLLAAIVLIALAICSPYRLARLTTFLNPWAYQYHSGYQLVQSLIAFGRGGIDGVGLGNSVQKLFYLPEAHTDFLFAVLAEELGLIGTISVIILYTILVWRALLIGRLAQLARLPAAAYIAYGSAIWIGAQAAVNIGVNAGILPTKGLTLPLMSYGGSSMVVTCAIIGLLLRVDFETQTTGLLIRPSATPSSFSRDYGPHT